MSDNIRFSKQDTRTIHQDSPLLKLPAELRNRIYEDVLASDNRITVVSVYGFKEMRKECIRKNWVPALLLSCRQIHEEASGMFFTKTTFLAEGNNVGLKAEKRLHLAVAIWLKALSRKDRLSLQKVCLNDECYFTARDAKRRIIKCCGSLRSQGVEAVRRDVIHAELHERTRVIEKVGGDIWVNESTLNLR